MKIAYCSLLLPEEKRLAERAKKRLPGISLHKFTRAVINGIDENLPEPVTVFNIINTHNYPNFPDITFPTEAWSHVPGAQDWHIGYINLFGIKYITQANNLFKKLDAWRAAQGDEHCVICVHHIFYPAMQAAVNMKKKYGSRVTICLITGDMTGKFGLASQHKPSLKQKLTGNLEQKIDALAKAFDCYVFATKDMAEAFGVAHKPFTVVECAYLAPPYDGQSVYPEDLDHKTLFYAGALREEYGIPHLLRAFSMIEDPTYRLQLAGDGNVADMVRQYAQKDPRIEYLGFITPQQVDMYQQKATAQISPRIAGNYEFVKYSFPSKTMECLTSGKPYIAHKLPCDPPEYAAHIQYAADESDEALRDKILEICQLPLEERTRIGQASREFILKEKNPKAMTTRIVDLWKEMERYHET